MSWGNVIWVGTSGIGGGAVLCSFPDGLHGPHIECRASIYCGVPTWKYEVFA